MKPTLEINSTLDPLVVGNAVLAEIDAMSDWRTLKSSMSMGSHPGLGSMGMQTMIYR